MRFQIVLRVVTKLFVPFILLFALYVQIHGDFGPGGGFQAGVIFAAAFVLHTLVFGLDDTQRIARPPLVHALIAFGVLLYAGTGVAGLLMGGNFLEYGAFGHGEHGLAHGNHIGILAVEFGVGITVASVVVTIFYAFAGRR